MNITTKKGDRGTTSLADGTRVDKDCLRIELNGQLDTLSACLGLCKAASGQQEPYATVQRALVGIMALVAKASASLSANEERLVAEAISQMERTINDSPSFPGFALPGSDLADAALHMARTTARTCERRMVALARVEPVPPLLLVYLNRLSDYLYVLAVCRR